jgi:hypothetical protein
MVIALLVFIGFVKPSEASSEKPDDFQDMSDAGPSAEHPCFGGDGT